MRIQIYEGDTLQKQEALPDSKCLFIHNLLRLNNLIQIGKFIYRIIRTDTKFITKHGINIKITVEKLD